MEKYKGLIKDIIQIIVSVVIITFILINFILMPVRVEGISMYPTLNNNDFGYSFILTKNLGINRFDIAIVDLEDKLLVKRVIGLPGDKIEYKDNILYINDEIVEEEFLNDVFTEDFEAFVEEDEYFCLGDNRNNSRDSRYYGAFPKDKIKATHVFVLWPLSDIGFK